MDGNEDEDICANKSLIDSMFCERERENEERMRMRRRGRRERGGENPQRHVILTVVVSSCICHTQPIQWKVGVRSVRGFFRGSFS